MNERIFVVCLEINTIKAKKEIEKRLALIGDWVEVLEHVYVVKSANPFLDSDMVRMQLQTPSPNGKMFVMKTSIDAAWATSPSVDAWLKTNI